MTFIEKGILASNCLLFYFRQGAKTDAVIERVRRLRLNKLNTQLRREIRSANQILRRDVSIGWRGGGVGW